jgi:type IV pilus assembly protein PilC
MGKFEFTAIAADGATITGVESGADTTVVRKLLREKSLQPIKIQAKKSILQLEITRKKVPRKELMHFSRQMAVFLRAGIPILDALIVISEETGNKIFKATLEDMSDSLRSGGTFAGAAAEHPEAFPDFYLGILKSAELTGNLDNVLDQLAEYIDRDLEARRKITSALVYPAVVMVMSVVTVVVLTMFVLPRFKTFFANLNAELPLPTRILLSTTDFLGRWSWLIGLLLVAAIFSIVFGLRTDRGKETRDKLLLKAPVLGDVVKLAVLERFCRILSSMVGSGVPLPDAMEVTAEGTNNVVFRRGIIDARERMIRGEGLAQPLTDTGLFPAAARQMFRVGEDTGTLDQQLETAAVYFDRELDYKIKQFTNLFEPAVILAMGLIVGFVAIALVSAMYGIFNQVQV